MLTSTGSTASLPYTRTNDKCFVASFVVVRVDQSTLGKSSTPAPFAASKDFLIPLRTISLADSTCQFVCGLERLKVSLYFESGKQ